MIKRSIVWAIVSVFFGIVPIIAQTTSCEAWIDDALSVLGDNCAELSRNGICYNHNQVGVTLFDDVADFDFAVPSLDRIRIVSTIESDATQNPLGVAVMNIQANIPNTVAGSGVMMTLIGDAIIENKVHPLLANTIGQPLSTVVTMPSNIYQLPVEVAEVVDVLDVESVVWVDGFDPTREWLRVVNAGNVGWIRTANVTRLTAMERLPLIGASHPSAMQSIYLRTGSDEVDCFDAEPVIALQTPDAIPVDMTINGVDMKIDGMVTFKNLDDGLIKLTVHRGQVTTVFGNTITAGQSVVGVLDTEVEQGAIVSWGDVFTMTSADAALGERAQAVFNRVISSNGWDVNVVGSDLTHIVSAGETLFQIGRLYDASLIEIVNRNDLEEPYTLFSGDELMIPNPNSGFVGLPSDDRLERTQLSECEGFRLTSPLDGAPTEPTSYYWDGVMGATQYQVNLYDGVTGLLMGTGRTTGAETSIVLSAGEFGIGGMLRWEVVAYGDGELLCRTGLSQPMPHFAPVNPGE